MNPQAAAALERERTRYPNDLDTERAVVGALFMYPDHAPWILGQVRPGFCMDAAAQVIVETARGIAAAGEPVTMAALRARLLGAWTPEFAAKLAQIVANDAPPLSAMSSHIAVLRNLWAIRETLLAAERPGDAGSFDPAGAVGQMFDRIDEVRGEIAESSGKVGAFIGAAGLRVIDRAADAIAGRSIRATSTGLADLDLRLPMRGLAPGSLIVLAGRTGMGKTALCSTIARQAARLPTQSTAGVGTAYFSLEVPDEEIAARMISDALNNGPTYETILHGADLTDHEFSDATTAQRNLAEMPIYVDASPRLGMGEIEHRIKAVARKMDRKGSALKVAIIDHAQIVKATDRYAGNRVGELGEVANRGKEIAMRHDIAVVLCSQINRGPEGRDDKRPSMADLRASGELEEAADAVALLYRPAYYVERSTAFKQGQPEALEEFERVKNRLEVAIEKSRQGRPGHVALWCDAGRSAVRGMAWMHQD